MAESTKKPAATQLLPDSVFGVKVANHELLKLAYESYLANRRVATATTKTRGEVSGGGKKPWRQKGSGRARFGSTRNPIWRHGGIVFGPTGQENYTKKISRQAKHAALRQALSLAAQAGKITVINTFNCENGKTKETVSLLKDNNVVEKNRVLLVVSVKDELVNRATNNLPNLVVVSAKYLNVYHILNADRILISQASVDIVEQWLSLSTSAADHDPAITSSQKEDQ